MTTWILFRVPDILQTEISDNFENQWEPAKTCPINMFPKLLFLFDQWIRYNSFSINSMGSRSI